jgi:hypothetical protein
MPPDSKHLAVVVCAVDISELFSELDLTSSDDPAAKADVAQLIEP